MRGRRASGRRSSDPLDRNTGRHVPPNPVIRRIARSNKPIGAVVSLMRRAFLQAPQCNRISRMARAIAAGKSSATRPIPSISPARPCSHAPAQAASQGGMPPASKAAIKPDKTSPDAGRGQGGRAGAVDRGAGRPGGDDGVGSLQQHHRADPLGGRPACRQPIGPTGRIQFGKLPLMRGQHGGAAQASGWPAWAPSASASATTWRPAASSLGSAIAARCVLPQARAADPGGPPLVRQQRVQRAAIHDQPGGNMGCSVQQRPRRHNGHHASAAMPRRRCGEAGGARHAARRPAR